MQERKTQMPECFTKVISWGWEYRPWDLSCCIFGVLFSYTIWTVCRSGRLGRANQVLQTNCPRDSKVHPSNSISVFPDLEVEKGRQLLWRSFAVQWSRHWCLLPCWGGGPGCVGEGGWWHLSWGVGWMGLAAAKTPNFLSKTPLGSISYSTSK